MESPNLSKEAQKPADSPGVSYDVAAADEAGRQGAPLYAMKGFSQSLDADRSCVYVPHERLERRGALLWAYVDGMEPAFAIVPNCWYNQPPDKRARAVRAEADAKRDRAAWIEQSKGQSGPGGLRVTPESAARVAAAIRANAARMDEMAQLVADGVVAVREMYRRPWGLVMEDLWESPARQR